MTKGKEEKNVVVCKRCRGSGYYNVQVVGGKSEMGFFCDCMAGEELKKLSIQWRLSDIEKIAENVIPRLDIIKERLSEPEKAGTFIDELKKDLQRLRERAEDGLRR